MAGASRHGCLCTTPACYVCFPSSDLPQARSAARERDYGIPHRQTDSSHRAAAKHKLPDHRRRQKQLLRSIWGSIRDALGGIDTIRPSESQTIFSKQHFWLCTRRVGLGGCGAGSVANHRLQVRLEHSHQRAHTHSPIYDINFT